MSRLRRSDLSVPGITRRRRGRGWLYRAPAGEPLRDPSELERIASLAVPPAWRDVWICPWPGGHIQAAGTDAAGRRQYRYHDAWRARRDGEKFDRVLEVAARLPDMRARIVEDLAAPPLSRRQVLAATARLLDIGFFRVGGQEYADRNNSFGLTTVRREHVSVGDGEVIFDYPAKSGRQRIQTVADPDLVEVIRALLRRADKRPELLAYRDDSDGGGEWRGIDGTDVNDYLREICGGAPITAKDFRTWSATVLAAVALAVSAPVSGRRAGSETGRRRAVSRMYREVSGYLGNTPAVCRASYVHPRIVDLFLDGHTIASTLDELGEGAGPGDLATQGPVEAAVRDLFAGPRRGSPAAKGGRVRRSGRVGASAPEAA